MTTIEQEAAQLERAGIEADERERELALEFGEAVSVWDLEEVEAKLSRLDATHPLTRDRYAVWSRRREYLLGAGLEQAREAGARRRLTQLRAARAEVLSDAVVFGLGADEWRRKRVETLDGEIAELEAQLGVQKTPPAADPFAEAITAARVELDQLDREHADVVLKAFMGDEPAGAKVDELDRRRQEAKRQIAIAEAARDQAARAALEKQAKADQRDADKLAAEADRLAEECEDALGELFERAATLADEIVSLERLFAEAEAAARAAGRPAPRRTNMSLVVLLSAIEHGLVQAWPKNGPRVESPHVLQADSRRRLLERYGNRPRTEARCKCCALPNRAELEAALATSTQVEVAERFGVSRDSVRRHAAGHMGTRAAA